jgi:hypothetical protein|tara:strand:+ start:2847 stop:3089 length:243 start_codon:yes stop_codon:yes gene_type:complete
MKLFNNKTLWNFPIAKAGISNIKNFYNKHGLYKTILYIIFIIIGFKVFVINGVIFSLNTIFNLSIEYGPVLYYVLGIEVI